ncbi:hypothetical protein VPHK409_0026 [Vibrio phage K409]
MTQYPFIQTLNRPEPQWKFGQLPDFYQEFLKALHAQGVVVEVYGQKSRSWQPLHQRNVQWGSGQYYRLCGAENCTMLKAGKTHHEKPTWVFVTDPTRLPENSICYMVDGLALSASVIPFK